ncbi:hypothetical protein DS2_16864 [Catenovulum agarivorans DS-2]|uniref:Fe2OG dioxygenase domain-containing protein n=1 Tax=Catenovulum agarivorans DS-2 TaxID=1328313 RepID=W7QI40_9ALTE|nr:2OG-Fe(II) oxygenase [Catenovulum agarivorans]EWH08567.1 hypothetical protein DS2_16864 [Catenovulum agarivorans DS-2]
MPAIFDASWQNWLRENINRGCDPDELYQILVDNGFERNIILQQFIAAQSGQNVAGVTVNAETQLAEQLEVKQTIEKTRLHLAKQLKNNSKFHQIDSDSIELYTVEQFLTARECEQIIDLIKTKLRPSELASFTSDCEFRTSRTCDLGAIDNPLIQMVDQRIYKLMNIEAGFAEVTQGQYYEVGQQFKAHTDYFEGEELTNHGGKMGQRTYTVMIYLNDVEAGGATRFIRQNKAFKPKQGMAVIWNSLTDNLVGNGNTLHQAEPVQAGYKAVITKWFRQHQA